MTTTMIIRAADNGILVDFGEWIHVIEDTHVENGADKDNLFKELGRFFYGKVKFIMNEESVTTVEVEMEITPVK